MNVAATLKYARFSAQKGRLVANQIRGLSIDKALGVLEFSKKRAAKIVKKALESAVSNAENNKGADVDELYISAISVNDGPILKRIKHRAKGRADHVLKRMCHVTVKVSDEKREDKS